MQKPSVQRTFLTACLWALPTVMVWAQTAAAPALSPVAKAPVNPMILQLPMYLGIAALFYYMLIAPQRKQQKVIGDFQKSLAKGDEVVTSSGIIGTVAGLTEKVVTLEVSPGTEIKVMRSRVDAKLKDLTAAEVKA